MQTSFCFWSFRSNFVRVARDLSSTKSDLGLPTGVRWWTGNPAPVTSGCFSNYRIPVAYNERIWQHSPFVYLTRTREFLPNSPQRWQALSDRLLSYFRPLPGTRPRLSSSTALAIPVMAGLTPSRTGDAANVLMKSSSFCPTRHPSPLLATWA